MNVSIGSLVSLADRAHATYQVLNVDEFSDCIWVRRWPLQEPRSQAFGVPLDQVSPLPPKVAA
jgi:hypothetical protein